MPEHLILLAEPGNPDGADLTFRRIIECIHQAKNSIAIHMFVWRCDAIGNQIATAILAAADRGVKVNIIKDTDALMYETIEMNRKPLLNKPLAAVKRLTYKLMALTFPDTYIADDFDCETGNRLLAHKNVKVEWVDHTHAKYYVFDNEIMITGSINIEDRHRGYRDYMVELNGRDVIERFAQRLSGTVPFDTARSFDFLLNRKDAGLSHFEIKPYMLQQLAAAKRSIYIEMAYIGDPDISNAIIKASNRGIDVKMLFSAKANVGNDINYKAMYEIARQSKVKVFLTEKMIHSKLMLLDEKTVIVGSANISVYSMQKGVELDLVISDQPVFLAALKVEIQNRIADSKEVSDIKQLDEYNHVLAALQQLHQKLS